MFLVRLSLLGLLSTFLTGSVQGQDWVKAMFEETTFDFGNVPRGAKAEYSFKLTNKYQEDVHIVDVRSSCGCTLPRVKQGQDTLRTYQEGEIICAFDTRSFIGPKSAVVTVVFDKPFYGEMQLNVQGNIRSDIVTEPGEIQFGEVDRGSSQETTVSVKYVGQKNWEIKDVRSANKHLGVSLTKSAEAGAIAYTMQVRLKETAPAGPFNDQIVLVTNDTQFNLVTVPVRGNIKLPLEIRPSPINLGTIQSDAPVTRRMVIAGKEPFEIEDVVCSDKRLKFTIPTGKKKAHIIPVEFRSDGEAGAFKKIVKVVTSLAADETATTIISGNVAGENAGN